MNNLKLMFLYTLAIGLFSFTSCGDDDLVIPNEEELITTLEYNLIPPTGDPVVLKFQDSDGDGGNAPVITAGTLKANTVYTGSLSLLNESASPFENITEEIEEEQEDHQFFYETTVADLNIEYQDSDANGNPIGLATTLTTGTNSSGTLRIILKHKPNKTAAGVATGDVTNAGGETDIEVLFEITVE